MGKFMKNFIKVVVLTLLSLCCFNSLFSQVDSLIIFLNDGTQKSVAIDELAKANFAPVEMVIQEIILNQGWNLISTNIIPKLPDFMDNIWANNTDKFVIAKNNSGAVFIPQFGINNIGRWDITQGYQVYSTAADTVYISGEVVNPPEKEIELKTGWNMTAFLCNTLMNAATAFSSITDNNNLLIAKNQEGQVYIPSFGINSLGNLIPGQGYRLYVTSNDVLIYP